MRLGLLVLVTCALVAVVAVVAWPRAGAPRSTPPPAPAPQTPDRSGIECVMPDPALDEDMARAGNGNDVAADETSVRALLHDLVLAQARFQAMDAADVDGDGVGEYGSLGELAGLVDVRGGARLARPLLPQLGQGDRGRYRHAGYYLRLHLAADDADLAETTWCCYAWPVQAGAGRTFFVNQYGDVLANRESPYGGKREPAPAAAYARGQRVLTGEAAVNTKGNDGAIWRAVR